VAPPGDCARSAAASPHDARRPERRSSAHHAAPAAARAHAVRRGGRVAGLHAHLLDRHRQRIGERLGDRRQVPLALADDADLRRDAAVGSIRTIAASWPDPAMPGRL